MPATVSPTRQPGTEGRRGSQRIGAQDEKGLVGEPGRGEDVRRVFTAATTVAGREGGEPVFQAQRMEDGAGHGRQRFRQRGRPRDGIPSQPATILLMGIEDELPDALEVPPLFMPIDLSPGEGIPVAMVGTVQKSEKIAAGCESGTGAQPREHRPCQAFGAPDL